MTYLILTPSGRPVKQFISLAKAREYIHKTDMHIKYIPNFGEKLVKPTEDRPRERS